MRTKNVTDRVVSPYGGFPDIRAIYGNYEGTFGDLAKIRRDGLTTVYSYTYACYGRWISAPTFNIRFERRAFRFFVPGSPVQ